MLNLFKKSSATKESSKEPKYFEVWGESLENVQSLRKVVAGLILLNAMTMVLLSRSGNKPPLVIRVNDVGHAEPVKAFDMSGRVSKPEVLNFVRLFLKFFLERNAYTWKENLAEAGRMMTPEFKDKINKEVDVNADVLEIQANKLTSTLTISSVDVVRETGENLIVTVKGWRQVSSYTDPAYRKELIFSGEIVLKKTTRSMETPHGLLVDSYKQTDFKHE